jgi:kynurenine formamidase
MRRGATANTSTITFSTHSGTHVDAPRHFCGQGKTIADCLAVVTVFYPVYCIDVPKGAAEEIMVSDLENRISHVQDAEAILIRTGWHRVRSGNPERYCTDHPWVSPDVSRFLREQCPGLRLFGLDQISISSPLQRETGHACHRAFLCGERPVLLLEDLDLSNDRVTKRFRMHIFPVFIDDIDGIPVTVIAEIP